MTNEGGAGVHHGQARRQESLLGACSRMRLPFVSGYATILSIFASDKSAFGKIQLSLYDMPSIQKEKVGAPSPDRRESTSTCKHGAGLAELAFHGMSGTQWTPLPTENNNASP